MSREKPYLFVDAQRQLQRPRACRPDGHAGRLVGRRHDAGTHHPAVATSSSRSPSDSVQTINNQLARGKNLLLTPGVYDIERSIDVKRAEHRGARPGPRDADRGQRRGSAERRGRPRRRHRRASRSTRAPSSRRCCCGWARRTATTASRTMTRRTRPPCQRRVLPRGRAAHRQGDVALEVNSDNVLIDHTWVWRADHGVEGFSGDTERWNTNTGRNGVVINGDDVTATGLFVEHFQQYNTHLERRERHHDPVPERTALRPAHPGRLDARRRQWAGPRYKVGDQVTTHKLVRRRCLRLQPEQPVDPHRERLRGARDARASSCTTS